jgi:hypothetical protein
VPARIVSHAVHVDELQYSALPFVVTQSAEFWGRL